MQKRRKTNAGCVYNLVYHIIWCSKYLKKVLVGEVEDAPAVESNHASP